MNDAARLKTIRAQLAAIEPADWCLVSDRGGMAVEARRPGGAAAPIARFDAGASADDMQFAAAAPSTVRFLLTLVDRAIDRLRPQAGPARHGGHAKTPDFAAECAMTCARPAFRVYLETSHGLDRPLTEERVAQKVRSILGVTSRRELNSSALAAARWKELRSAFEAWRRGRG